MNERITKSILGFYPLACLRLVRRHPRAAVTGSSGGARLCPTAVRYSFGRHAVRQILSCTSLFFGHVTQAMLPYPASFRIKFVSNRLKNKLPTYSKLNNFFFKKVSIAPLVVFRILFGGLLLYSTRRTIDKGWVDELYVAPSYHFSFVDWIQPLDAQGMHLIFSILSIAAIGIILGLLYRASTTVFFFLFLYVELIDKTFYLNHYYLVSLLTFWMILIPAHRAYSIDAWLFPSIRKTSCLNWHILILKIQLSIVYFFAGLAKVNPDWLFRAQPMATWLPGKYEIPILGKWLHLKEVAYVFSWAGCMYDLTIWIFLWVKRTRGFAYFFVLVFHILTGILFPRIGMFPYIMITSTIIFFSPGWHERVLSLLPFSPDFEDGGQKQVSKSRFQKITTFLLLGYIAVQLILPLRHVLYPDNLFWNEKGYRFSWRVMLMEKNGYTSIIVKDPKTNVQKEIDANLYLTPFQKQQMKSQPDMILQFGRHIGDQFHQENGYAPEIYVDSRMSLNGRRSQPFTDNTIDIFAEDSFNFYDWILPLKK